MHENANIPILPATVVASPKGSGHLWHHGAGCSDDVGPNYGADQHTLQRMLAAAAIPRQSIFTEGWVFQMLEISSSKEGVKKKQVDMVHNSTTYMLNFLV